MPAFLLPILIKFSPYILMAVAALAAYLGIRHQGTKAAKEKYEKAQSDALRATLDKITKAESKDEAIDARAQEQIDAIRKTADDPIVGDRFKF